MSESSASGVLLQIERLRGLPQPSLPPGYSLRGWQSGDEQRLPELLGEAFGARRATYVSLQRFWQDHPGLGPRRVMLLEMDREIVATASARIDPSTACGWIHLVAVRFDHARRRLGTEVVLAALRRLAEDGATRVLVGTGIHRLPAIRLYLQLGFAPLIRDEEAEAAWARLRSALGEAGNHR